MRAPAPAAPPRDEFFQADGARERANLIINTDSNQSQAADAQQTWTERR